jgi:heme exporter protein D
VTGSWPYVIAAWAIVLGAFVGYAVVTVVRGRSLSRQVPPEQRRWS